MDGLRKAKVFGSRSFHASASTLWNSLPCSVRFCESLTTFRENTLKHFVSNLHSLMPPSNPIAQRLRFNSKFLALYKLIYLLN